MSYQSRGRSITEVLLAAVLLGFLSGFVCVLCVGNYFRAKRAMERQRQRRLARFSNGGNGYVDSPRSHHSAATSGGSSGDEQQLLLTKTPDPRELQRRRQYDDANDLLLIEETNPPRSNIMSV